MTTIPAIYENGVLRPLAPLTLPEHTEVRISVEVARPGAPAPERDRVRAALVAAGLSAPNAPAPGRDSQLSPERREELARLFSSESPISDLITKEREGR